VNLAKILGIVPDHQTSEFDVVKTTGVNRKAVGKH